jgi:hypothetical protein
VEYLSDLNGGHEVWGSGDFDRVYCLEDLAHVLGHGDFHLGPRVSGEDELGGYIAPARVMTPTVLSALDCTLALKIMVTASPWAPNRVGAKSPFRVCSELSTLNESVLAQPKAMGDIHYHRRFETHVDCETVMEMN